MNPTLIGPAPVYSSGADRRYFTPTIDKVKHDLLIPEKPTLNKIPTGVDFNDGMGFVANGATFNYQPTHRYRYTIGQWRKTFGPDELTVNPFTGAISLDTSTMPIIEGQQPSQSVYVGVALENSSGSDEIIFPLHIGVAVSSVHKVGATQTHTTMESLLTSGEVLSGHTVIVEDGVYSGDENRITILNGVSRNFPGGTTSGYTTIMARTPGEWIFDGLGFSPSAVNIVGDELNIDTEWSNGGARAGEMRNYTCVQGIRTRNCTSSSLGCTYVKKVTFRYCWPGDANYFAGTHNVVVVNVANAHHCLIENVFPHGYGRYKIGCYQVNSIMVRNVVTRFTPYFGMEPSSSGVSFYRARDCEAQNCFVVDSHNRAYQMNTDTAILTQAFQIASTGAPTFSTGNKFHRCGASGVDTGFLHASGNALPAGTWGAHATDFVGHDSRLYEGFSQRGIIDGNYVKVDRGLFMNVNSENSPSDIAAGYIFQDRNKDVTDTMFHNIGLNNAGELEIQRQFADPWAQNGPAVLTLEHCSITNFLGQMLSDSRQTNYPGSLVDNNREDLAPTPANGIRYLGRREPGSAAETAGLGPENTLMRMGKMGTFVGDIDANYETGIPVWPMQGEAIANTHFREYAFDQTGLPNAPPPFDGNFGVALEGESFGYWWLSRLGESVFPLGFDGAVEPGSARLSWMLPPDLHRPNYIGTKIFRDGVQVGQVTAEENNFYDTGLTNGQAYTYYGVNIHSELGDSGPSFSVTLTPSV